MDFMETSTPGAARTDRVDEVNSIDVDPHLAIVYTVIGCVGILGNLFVLLVMLRFKDLRETVTNLFIINQSLIDLAASFFIIATSLLRDEDAVPRGLAREIFCRAWLTNFPVWAMLVSSTYNLMVVTYERYFAIVHPLKFGWRISRRRAYALIVVVWVAGPVYNASYMFPTSYVNSEGNCSVLSVWPNEFAHSAHGVLTVVIQFFIPLFAITCANYRIAQALQAQFKRCQGEGTAATQRRLRIMKARNNTVKTLVLIFVCFIMCWVWNQVYYLLFNLSYPNIRLKGTFYHISVIAVFCNSCLNPVVYVIKYKKFQQAVVMLVCCRRRGNTDQAATPQTQDSPKPISQMAMTTPPEGRDNQAFIPNDFYPI